MTDGTVYAVASGKGGVGKTTTAVNLGAAFVEAGRSVVVADVDLGMANLEDFLDVETVETTLHDVLAGEASIDDAIVSAPGGFDAVLGSPSMEAYGLADPANLRRVVQDLRERYEVVVLDGGGGLSHDVTVPLGLADGVVIVTTPADAAITNATKTKELVERLDGTNEGMIVTRIGGAGRATPEVVSDRIDLPVLGAVPEDKTIKRSMDEGTPLVSIDRESPAAQSYREIAYNILGEPLPRDWAEERGDPVGASVATDSVAESPEPESRSAAGEETEASVESPPGEDPVAEPDEPTATTGRAIDEAESDGHPATGIADRLETMVGEADGEAEAERETDAGKPTGTEPVPEGEREAVAGDGEVISGPTESTSEETEESAGGVSLLSRLFGGLFG